MPVAGARVVVRGEDHPLIRETVTDAGGRFWFSILPSGHYTVTAQRGGYSTVTLVGVAVHPGETRRVELQVSVTEEEESVTETINEEILLQGTAPGWVVPVMESEQLPLFRGTVGEVASLFPGGSRPRVEDFVERLPIESAGLAASIAAPNGGEIGSASKGIIVAVPRFVGSAPAGSVRLVYGERLSRSRSEIDSNAERAEDHWYRGVLTIGGPIGDGRMSSFLSIDHRNEGRDCVVTTGGIDPGVDGRAYDASSEASRVVATLALETAPSGSVFFVASGSRNEGPAGAGPLAASSAVGDLATETWSIRAMHSWQVSSRTSNLLSLEVENEDSTFAGGDAEAWLYPSGFRKGATDALALRKRSRGVRLDEQIAWLAGARSRHEIRAGLGVRLGVDDRVTYTPTLVQIVLRDDSAGSPAAEITAMSGGGTFEGIWDGFALWFEDEISAGRLQLRLGVRTDWWRGIELDQSANELWAALASQREYREPYLAAFADSASTTKLDGIKLAPRISLSWSLGSDHATLVRGSWGRFHEAPDPLNTLALSGLYGSGRLGVTYHASAVSGIRLPDGSEWLPGMPLPPADASGFLANEVVSPDIRAMRTDRVAIGISREVSGLAALSLDLVSSSVRNIPYLLRANSRLDASGLGQATRRFPEFGDFRIRMFDGEADFFEATLGARIDAFGKADAVLTYTWSESEGNVAPWPAESTAAQPDALVGRDAFANPLDPGCAACYGPIQGVPEHRASLVMRGDLPAGWAAAAIVRYRSGLPYTRLDERLADTNGDGWRQDLSEGAGGVNDAHGPSSTTLDVSISRTFAVGELSGRVALDVFNATGDGVPSGIDRFGVPTSFAGDPGTAPGRTLAVNLAVRFGY